MISFFVLFSVGSYFLTNRLLNEIRPRYLESMEESIHDMANILAAMVENRLGPGKKLTPAVFSSEFKTALQNITSRKINAKIYAFEKTAIRLRVYATDATGTVVFDSKNGALGENYRRWNDVYLTLKGKYGARSSRDDSDYPGVSVKYIAAPIMQQGKIAGVLTIGKPSISLANFISNANRDVLFATLLTFASFLVLILIISVLITQPIERLINYTKDIAAGKKAILPRLPSSDMAELGAAFEEMRDALEGKKYIEHYIQDLTHELKSPISSLVGAAEILQEGVSGKQQRKFLSNIKNESLRVKAIAEKMLSLSAVERQKTLDEAETFSTKPFFDEITASLEPQISQKKIELTVEIADHQLMGDRNLLKKAITNLLDNAIDFTPVGGRVKVALALENDEQDRKLVQLSVYNTGEPIPDFAKERLFERFYSLERPLTKKKSTGLGLSFVLEVAKLHNGDVVVENHGEGVRALLRLPA